MYKNYLFAPLCMALLLLVSVTTIKAQDAPSTGLAPFVYSTEKPSVVFNDLAATSRGFSYNSTSLTASTLIKYFLSTPGSATNIGSAQPYFLGSGDQCGPTGSQVIYVIQQLSPYSLYSVDTTTGALTDLGTITGINPAHSSGGITGLCWDATSNTAYVSSTSITESELYTFNLSTRVATPVGSAITNAPGIIALACNPGGTIFGIDLVNDNLWKFNKSNGTATLVGPLGMDANYGQDADFDPRDGILYWAAIGTSNTANLRTVDTTTGASTQIGLFTGQNQVLATTIPAVSGPPPQHDYAAGPFLGLQISYPIGTASNIRARITNVGQSNETSVPIKFFVDGAQVGSSINLSLNAGQNDSVSFAWTPSAGGTHNVRIIAALSTDNNRGNDTVSANVLVLAGTAYVGGATTVCRNGLNITIPDNTSIFDSLQVTIPTWAFGIADVNAKIDTVFHTWDSDLSYTLSHGATSVGIITNVGGSGDNFIGTILNDSATTPIASGVAPFTGSFIPSSPLAAFNGIGANPNGGWHLEIHDGAAGDTGILKAWCVTISYYTYVGGIGTITVPNYFALGQNYPNPFNPSTKIQYAIPRSANVSLIVYDILGRQVATLVNEFKNAGIYTLDFNASSLASGVYFYKIQAGTFSDTKKMLLVK